MKQSDNKRGFASDNNAGVHPEILESMQDANTGHVIAYGDDPFTVSAIQTMKGIFGHDAEIFFVFTGTAANVLGLATLTQPYHAIICPDTAHINVDECGAPEKFTGCKLLSLATPDGKLTIDLIKRHMHGFGFEHHVQPKVISITQATEMGTVYSIEEIRKIADYAHAHDMYLHMDGARISNAAVTIDSGFYEMTGGAGVDVLSFGGTKNGLMYGEAIVFFNKTLCEDFKYRRKQGMQLTSKMRYIAVQFERFLSNDLWKRSAAHANEMARQLYKAVKDIEGIEITQNVESNAVFARIPGELIPLLQQEYFFYVWDEATSEVRWMCSFDTTNEDIQGFSDLLKEKVSNYLRNSRT